MVYVFPSTCSSVVVIMTFSHVYFALLRCLCQCSKAVGGNVCAVMTIFCG